jgi:hypothetical protein
MEENTCIAKREGALCVLGFSFIACTLRRVKIDKHCMHSKPKSGGVQI